jgi:hypothetical protein
MMKKILILAVASFLVVACGKDEDKQNTAQNAEPTRFEKNKEKFKKAAGEMGEATKEIASEAYEKTKAGSKELYEKTKEGSKELWETSKEKSKDLMEKADNMADKAIDAIKNNDYTGKDDPNWQPVD